MSRIIDNIIAFKLLKMLVTPFNETDAFKLGIIDEKGKVLKKYNTLSKSEERDAYTYLDRLVFNVKRVISKIGGENKLKSLATALFLIKENYYNLDSDDNDILTEENEQLMEDYFVMLMEDEDILEFDLVETFLAEEMVSTAAIPSEPTGETTPTISPKKKLKMLRRKVEQS